MAEIQRKRKDVWSEHDSMTCHLGHMLFKYKYHKCSLVLTFAVGFHRNVKEGGRVALLMCYGKMPHIFFLFLFFLTVMLAQFMA